jgi:putative PIN family toxin of toxin-antitoxin system
MKARERVVVDTNTLISRLLLPASVPAQAVRQTVEETQLLASDATLVELAEVLARSKFDRYLTISERQEFLRLFGRIAERIPIIRRARLPGPEGRQVSRACSQWRSARDHDRGC